MKSCLAIFLILIVQTALCKESKWDWVKSSEGKNSDSIIETLKKLKFLKSELPLFQQDFGFQKKNKKIKLDEALMTVLGGPPDDSQSPDENSIIITGCRFNSCDEKGFYWANSKDKVSVMAIVHFVYQEKFESFPQLFLASKNFKCGEYPELVITQINSWLKSKKVNPQKIRCLQEGRVSDVKI